MGDAPEKVYGIYGGMVWHFYDDNIHEEGQVKYIRADIADKKRQDVFGRTFNEAYAKGQQEATKNIKTVWEKYKDEYDEIGHLEIDEFGEIWQAIKADLNES